MTYDSKLLHFELNSMENYHRYERNDLKHVLQTYNNKSV